MRAQLKSGRMCHLSIVRQPPPRRHVMRGQAAVRVTPAWVVIVCALAFAVCAFAMVKW